LKKKKKEIKIIEITHTGKYLQELMGSPISKGLTCLAMETSKIFVLFP